MKTLLNKMNVDYMKQPLFLGEDLGLQRYDRFKYPVFFDLFKKQREFFWSPEEIELKKDRSDFKEMSDNEKFIFSSNLKYQTMLDSVICRGVPTLLEYVSNPELEASMKTWEFFEFNFLWRPKELSLFLKQIKKYRILKLIVSL